MAAGERSSDLDEHEKNVNSSRMRMQVFISPATLHSASINSI